MYVSDVSDSVIFDFICKHTDLVLYNDCVNHKREHAGVLKSNILAFIHPFYPEFVARNFSQEDYIEHKLVKTPEYVSYKSVVKGLINGLHDDWSSVLFTFPEGYHSLKELVENGLFADVIFTLKGKGLIINKSEIDKFKDKHVVFLGCYAEDCMSTVINEFTKKKISDLSVLLEGIMFSQSHPEGIKRSNDYLLERYMNNGVMTKVPIVKLKDIISSLR